jgi:hypothetical protein
MVEIDISGIATFMPVFGFLLVFTVIYALLSKTKALGDNKFVSLIVSFAVAIIFLISSTAIEVVKNITPWVAVFAVLLVFVVLLVGVILKGDALEKVFTPAFGWFIVIVVMLFFVISGAMVFNKIYTMPSWTKQPQIIGVAILGIITVIASWLLTMKNK